MKCLHLFSSVMVASSLLWSQGYCLDTIGGSNYKDLESLMIIVDWREYIYEQAGFTMDQVKKDCASKAKEYKRIADEKFNEAQRNCLLFPYDDQQAAIKCFKDAIVMGTTNRDWAGLIRSLVICLADYGLSVYQEWHRMESLLRESEHYYELYKIHMEAANLEITGMIGKTEW
jgi:hypothetical protein